VLEAFPGAHVVQVEPGWEERWRAFHRGARIGPLWVGPPWESPPPGSLPVTIDPGRAFGTGAHPSTRLCLELLTGLRPASLLDVGCGSGVLAIAAARLGFAPVVAVDAAAEAVAATCANAAANGVRVDVHRLDALADGLPPAELVVANIALDVVEALASHLDAPLLVTSGYLSRDEPRLQGYRLRARLERNGWAGSLHERSLYGGK
jgi:ribosomal protein L11 methyltransferase